MHLTITGAGFEKLLFNFKTNNMQPEIILKSDVLDILFENRNKEYGAYALRRDYDAHMRKAIVITFSMAALLLMLAFSFKTKPVIAQSPLTPDTIVLRQPPVNIKPKTDPPKIAQAIAVKKSVKPVAAVPFTKTAIVKDDQATPKIATVAEVLKSNIADTKTTGALNAGQQNITPPNPNGDKGNQPGITTGNTTAPIDNPDVYPQFPGGTAALLKFLKKNIYPLSVEDGQTVDVKIRFVVNADGSISNFEIVKSGGDEFDNEVMRVAKKMPNWIAGKSNGRDVSVYYEVPVKFVADNP